MYFKNREKQKIEINIKRNKKRTNKNIKRKKNYQKGKVKEI